MGRSMVAVSSGGEKSPKCNVITNDKKSKKTEEPKESKNSPTPRRISARIQAKQNADAELLVCDKVEIKDNRDDAVDVKNVTPCKTNGNHENVGEERKRSKESPMPKRSSPRIQGKQKADKELPVDSIVEIVDDLGGSGEEEKKSNHCKRIPKDENVVQEEAVKKQQTAKNLDESATEEATESNEPSMQRRRSSRVQAKQKLDKEHLVRRRVELLDDADEGKKSKRCKRSGNHETVGKEEVVGEQLRVKNPSTLLDDKLTIVRSEGATDCANGVGNLVDKSDFVKVKETLRLFNKHYLHFVQEEEKRVTIDRKLAKIDLKSKTKNGSAPKDKKNPAKRPDLKAISKMLQNKEVLNHEKRIGNIPGIKVGHQFYSRAEMVVVGFHRHWLNGIDYMGQSYSKVLQYSNHEFPLAVAIVLSGMYEDDLDNAEDVVYTGQGGHNLTGDKRQNGDQVLERGNLALKNCLEQRVPVRVVRGHESSSSYCGKVYTYDGLYQVVSYWAEKGISGFTVFKFRLRRLEGQPTLTTNQVHFTNGRVPQSVAEIRGLVCKDIAEGQENIPIPATNLVDDPPVAPTDFTYRRSHLVSKNIKLPNDAPGCKCKGICVDPTSCECAARNGGDFPYVSRDGGRLIEAKDVVFECGPNCGCGPGCVNRTSQKGLRYRLEVFRTPKKGWAVRSWDFIPSGAPVCEYIGLLRRAEDLENTSENNYIFEIDCLQTMKGIGGRERRSQCEVASVNLLEKSKDDVSESIPEFCVDAGSTGNIARFINHSCEPNLFVQCVLSSHHDLKLARVMLFAADNIPPLQELTYDYGYALDSVMGPDGKVKEMMCYCGAGECRKRLF